MSEVGNRYAHRALPADEDHPALRDFLANVCAGGGPRLWTQYRQQPRWLFPPPAQLWTSLTGALWLDEPVTPKTIAGAACVLAGVALASRKKPAG